VTGSRNRAGAGPGGGVAGADGAPAADEDHPHQGVLSTELRSQRRQAFPQSNMVVLVDTDAGITGVGQGGSPDTVRNVARSVIGKNAFDTEMIWQAAFMDGFYSPGKERLHAIGAIDLALWDIKGKALNAPLYQLFGGKAREHVELYATLGLPQGVVPPAEAAAMGLKERAAATMAAGYRVYRVDGGILPSTGAPRQAARRRSSRCAAASSIRGRASRRSSRRSSRFARASGRTATG
jgi:L-alanine-DL-glutamate epimerase-like enolase superfamily enzyme